MLVNKLYYYMKPAIPRYLQVSLRRYRVAKQLHSSLNVWPIDPVAGKKPDGWPDWPEGKRFALVLTHDVETSVGQKRCIKLKHIEQSLGFRSSFYFVPERYRVSSDVLRSLRESGFEIGVHGLYHDGKLFDSRSIFSERACRINEYLSEWGAVGFRSPAMHHNLEWIHDLNIEYDSSTFDTDPFEPQPDGCRTIFPYFVADSNGGRGYYELPYTIPQDFTVFVLMKERSIDIWKKKLDWIVKNGGMALIDTHPDYMSFDSDKLGFGEYPHELYIAFLRYLEDCYSGEYCNLLPAELTRYLVDRNYV